MKNITRKNIQNSGIDIALRIYEVVDELPSEERFSSAAKLKSASTDLVFYTGRISESYEKSGSNLYDFDGLLRTANAIKNLYIFISKQFIDLEPEIVIELDSIVSFAKEGIKTSEKVIKKNSEKELEPWLKKYNLWKEMEK